MVFPSSDKLVEQIVYLKIITIIITRITPLAYIRILFSL